MAPDAPVDLQTHPHPIRRLKAFCRTGELAQKNIDFAALQLSL
jgi:hypothetical protein